MFVLFILTEIPIFAHQLSLLLFCLLFSSYLADKGTPVQDTVPVDITANEAFAAAPAPVPMSAAGTVIASSEAATSPTDTIVVPQQVAPSPDVATVAPPVIIAANALPPLSETLGPNADDPEKAPPASALTKASPDQGVIHHFHILESGPLGTNVTLSPKRGTVVISTIKPESTFLKHGVLIGDEIISVNDKTIMPHATEEERKHIYDVFLEARNRRPFKFSVVRQPREDQLNLHTPQPETNGKKMHLFHINPVFPKTPS